MSPELAVAYCCKWWDQKCQQSAEWWQDFAKKGIDDDVNILIITAQYIAQTDYTITVGYRNQIYTLPISQIGINDQYDSHVVIRLPLWLAEIKQITLWHMSRSRETSIRRGL